MGKAPYSSRIRLGAPEDHGRQSLRFQSGILKLTFTIDLSIIRALTLLLVVL
jgi:hypothetical protein